MAELESSLEQFFRKRVQLVGGYCVKLAPTRRGIPDRLVLMPGGRMYLVELKTEDGSVSAIQKQWHHRVAELGTHVYVVTGREGVLKWLRAAVGVTDPKSRRPPRTTKP